MKYPCLIPKTLCKTPVHITIYGSGISEDGEPEKAFEADLMCNYQSSSRVVLTKEQKKEETVATLLFCGDIAPGLAVISDGEAVIDDVKLKISKGIKARNPDGTVNYTKLELI